MAPKSVQIKHYAGNNSHKGHKDLKMKKLSEVKLPEDFYKKIADNVNITPDTTLPPECYYC